jgi:putative ABC transport system ATP-binding protein
LAAFLIVPSCLRIGVVHSASSAVTSTGELNVRDEPVGRVPTSSNPELILTLLVDRAEAEPGEEIKTLEVLFPDGFSATLLDVGDVVIDGVSVGFEAGRFTAIMGPSGSGKSTLMHCVAGLDDLSSGSVFIGDTELGSLSDRELTLLRRDQVGFIFQSFNLIPTLTAAENLTLPLDLAGRRPDRDWMDNLVSSLGIGDRLRHRPDELSGGQQQRVAIGRALVGRPSIVFADEPTGNLDSTTGGEVLDFLRQAVDDLEQTMVMVTHDANAAATANRVLFLGDGQIVAEMADPSADAILDRVKHLAG